jgi:hypothetical protein
MGTGDRAMLKHRDLTYTISMMVFIAAVTLFANVMILFPSMTASLFRGNTQVKAVSISGSENRPLFLNLEQKREILALLNESEELRSALSLEPSLLTVSIYSFEGQTPIDLQLSKHNEQMVVTFADGSRLIEKNPGGLEKIISKVYAGS